MHLFHRRLSTDSSVQGAILRLFLLCTLMGGMVACSDSGGLQPEIDSLSLARIKDDPGDPSVTETDPPEAPQDTTLQVLILGDGFDRGTTVEFGDEGDDGIFTPDPKVKATKVKYVNAKRLQADVTVAIDADLRLYDVAVRTSRGKKGIGTELFRVIEKVKTNSGDFELFSFQVRPATDFYPDLSGPIGLTADPEVNAAIYAVLDEEQPLEPNPAYPDLPASWADFLGCPDGPEGCSAITYVMNPAKALGFTMQLTPVVGGCAGPCILDTSLGNRRNSTLRSSYGVPSLIPWDLITPVIQSRPDGLETMTYFWQGQRGSPTYRYIGDEKVRGKLQPQYEYTMIWDRYPDMNPVGQTDAFVIHPYFMVGRNVWYHPTFSEPYLMANCDSWPGCIAYFRGGPGTGPLMAEWMPPTVNDGALEFAVKGIINDPADHPNPNPIAYSRVMMTLPDGRTMVKRDLSRSSSRDRETGVAATPLIVEDFDPSKCYRFDVVGQIVIEDQADTAPFDLRRVWTGGTAPLFYPEGCEVAGG